MGVATCCAGRMTPCMAVAVDKFDVNDIKQRFHQNQPKAESTPKLNRDQLVAKRKAASPDLWVRLTFRSCS